MEVAVQMTAAMRAKMVLTLALVTSLIAAILFGAAGRTDLPMFWAVIAVFASLFLIAMWSADPDLVQERRKPGPGGKDHSLRWNAILVFVAVLVTAGLDVGRRHWSDSVPLAAQITALVLVGAGLSLAGWASRTNRFHSSVARIQRDRGHHVVTTGPYAFIRHPTYLAGILWFPLTGLALGSWYAAALGLIAMPLFLRRLFIEEGMLFAELEGYREYAARVPYRLVPHVW